MKLNLYVRAVNAETVEVTATVAVAGTDSKKGADWSLPIIVFPKCGTPDGPQEGDIYRGGIDPEESNLWISYKKKAEDDKTQKGVSMIRFKTMSGEESNATQAEVLCPNCRRPMKIKSAHVGKQNDVILTFACQCQNQTWRNWHSVAVDFKVPQK